MLLLKRYEHIKRLKKSNSSNNSSIKLSSILHASLRSYFNLDTLCFYFLKRECKAFLINLMELSTKLLPHVHSSLEMFTPLCVVY